MSPYSRAGLLVCILVAIVLGLLWLRENHSTNGALSLIHDGTVDDRSAETYWESRIKLVGAKAAYGELITAGKSIPLVVGHELAHTFGRALYRTSGIAALAVCGSQLLSGCGHQFVGDAIAEHGVTVTRELSDACPDGIGHFGCEHGLGHGIAEHYGYSIDDLKKALSLCDSADVTRPAGGCADGAFMEYNLHEFIGTELGARPREFTPKTAYSPCTELGARYQSGCAFELSVWWASTLHDAFPTDVELFRKVGSLCDAVADRTFHRACMEGVGYSVGIRMGSGSDISIPQSLCTAAGQKPLDRLYCLSGAAALVRPEAGSAVSAAICSQAQGGKAALEYCNQYVLLSRSDRDAMTDPAL